MKKSNIILGVALLGFAACTTEEVFDLNSDDVISFRASISHSSSTRGPETTPGNLDKFYVTALEQLTVGWNSIIDTLFINNLFVKSKTSGNFYSSQEFRWTQKMVLDFYAYGYFTDNDYIKPGNTGSLFGTGVTFKKDRQSIDGFSPQQDIQKQIDLVAAKAINQKASALSGPVSLSFTHLLSEIQVVAKCSSNSYKVSVKGLKYGNIKSKGNYDFADNAWELMPESDQYVEGSYATSSYEVPFADHTVNLNSTEDYDHVDDGVKSFHDISKSEGELGYAMLIPQSLGEFESGQYWALGKNNTPPEGKTIASAQYMAMLIKIESIDASGNVTGTLFPQKDEHKVDNTDGYGWAYIPFYHKDHKSWNMGVRYIYHLDFKDGAGFNEDGDPILEGEVKLVATVNDWKNKDEIYRPVDTKPKDE